MKNSLLGLGLALVVAASAFASQTPSSTKPIASAKPQVASTHKVKAMQTVKGLKSTAKTARMSCCGGGGACCGGGNACCDKK